MQPMPGHLGPKAVSRQRPPVLCPSTLDFLPAIAGAGSAPEDKWTLPGFEPVMDLDIGRSAPPENPTDRAESSKLLVPALRVHVKGGGMDDMPGYLLV